MRVNTRYTNSTRGTSSKKEDVLLVEFMYLVFLFRGCTSDGVYVPCIPLLRMYFWWSLCTLYSSFDDVPLVEFMYLVFLFWGCTSGGAYVPCSPLLRMYFWWSLCTLYSSFEDVLLVEFMYLVFTRMPGESYRRRLRSLLLCLCDVFRALISLI